MPLIAIVDDDESVRRAIGRLLHAFGFDVETHASGEAFLASLTHRRPACVVLDLHMPGTSGIDVQRALATSDPGLPVVVVTGDDRGESRARALRLCSTEYLRKPVEDTTLLAAIDAAIRGAVPP